jgi:hypothetical protein
MWTASSICATTRLDQIEAAFRALGKELSIEVRDAA